MTSEMTRRIPDRRTPPPYKPLKSAAKAGTSALITWGGIVATVVMALFLEPSFVEQLKALVGDNKTWLGVLTLLQMAFVFYRDKVKHDVPTVEVPAEVVRDTPWTPREVGAFAREDAAILDRRRALHGDRRKTCPDAACDCGLPKRISRKPPAAPPVGTSGGDGGTV